MVDRNQTKNSFSELIINSQSYIYDITFKFVCFFCFFTQDVTKNSTEEIKIIYLQLFSPSLEIFADSF